MKRFCLLLTASVLLTLLPADPCSGQVLPKPPCNWIDAGPWQLQSGPGSVTAGPRLNAGTHVVWVAEKLGKPGMGYTPWRPYGPFNVQIGKKYLVSIRHGSPPIVSWLPEDARVAAYDNPGKSAVVYFYNGEADRFYGVAVCPSAPTLIMPPPTVPGTVVLKTSGTISKADPQDPGRKGSFHKTHTIRLETGRAYTLTLSGKPFDAYLRLEDPSGKEVARDDDGGPGLDAEIQAFRPAVSGTFRIVVTTYAAGATGDYTLTVNTWTSQVISRLEGSLVPGTVIGTDKAAAPGSPYKVGQYFRTFDVNFRLGVNYIVDLESKEFDTFLVIEDASGRVLASNDDSGGTSNSRLRFQVPLEGTYRVVATSYAPRTTGSFTIHVRKEE